MTKTTTTTTAETIATTNNNDNIDIDNDNTVTFTPAKPGAEKNATYECGLEAKGDVRRKHRPQPVGHDLDDRLLKRSAEIGDVLVAERRDGFGFEP